MERQLGRDFGDVRIHADARAAESAVAVHARAYTVGQHIVFAHGQYAPGSVQGRTLLTHELTHVRQQSDAVGGSGPLTVSSPADAAEVEATTAARNAPSSVRDPSSVNVAEHMSVQRACGPAAIGSVGGCVGRSGDVIQIGASSNELYLFQVGCDDFQPGEEARLRRYAAGIGTAETVAVYGSASEEGPAQFNDGLSCARAHRAQDVLLASGVAAWQITTLFKLGATPGPRAQRRSVVVQARPPRQPEAPAVEPETPTERMQDELDQLRRSDSDNPRIRQLEHYLADRRPPELEPCTAFLVFNGESLQWFSPDFHVPAFRARSGRVSGDVFDYTEERQRVANTGPIPEGKYWLGPHDLRAVRNPFDWPGWGRRRIVLHPFTDTDTHGRGGFFIHGGAESGSAGCIDLTADMTRFSMSLRRFWHANHYRCFARVYVTYPKDSVPKP